MENIFNSFTSSSILFSCLLPFRSLFNRFKRLEGALLCINISLILVFSPLSFFDTIFMATLSCYVLALLYAFNDIYDCQFDQNDPKKDQVLCRDLIKDYRNSLRWLVFEKLFTIGLVIAIGKPMSALMVALLFVVNFVYSQFVKRIPILDILWVGLWGSCYTLILALPIPFPLIIIVGIMTAVCHLGQICRDRDADCLNQINTSIVVFPQFSLLVLFSLCLLLGYFLSVMVNPFWASTALLPFFLFITFQKGETAWILSKVYFGFMWTSLLLAQYDFF